MKRQEAFINQKKMLKGGLHCHTTRSDGQGEPDEVIRLHKENDYDFLALTDHKLYNYKNFAEDVDITIIPGTEYDNTFVRENGFRTFHQVYIGPDDETNGFSQDEELPNGKARNQEEFQSYLDEENMKIIPMRSKVDAVDYKYYIEPNIPPIKIDDSWIEEIKVETEAPKIIESPTITETIEENVIDEDFEDEKELTYTNLEPTVEEARNEILKAWRRA